MSAYGTIAAPLRDSDAAPLLTRLYALPDDSKNLAVIPLRRESVPDALAEHLCNVCVCLSLSLSVSSLIAKLQSSISEPACMLRLSRSCSSSMAS